MEEARRIIETLLRLLDSPSCAFNNLSTTGARNVAIITDEARRFLAQPPIEVETDDDTV